MPWFAFGVYALDFSSSQQLPLLHGKHCIIKGQRPLRNDQGGTFVYVWFYSFIYLIFNYVHIQVCTGIQWSLSLGKRCRCPPSGLSILQSPSCPAPRPGVLSLCQSPLTALKSFPDEGWETCSSRVGKLLVVNFILHPLSIVTVVGSTQGPMTHLVTGSWPQ